MAAASLILQSILYAFVSSRYMLNMFVYVNIVIYNLPWQDCECYCYLTVGCDSCEYLVPGVSFDRRHDDVAEFFFAVVTYLVSDLECCRCLEVVGRGDCVKVVSIIELSIDSVIILGSTRQ